MSLMSVLHMNIHLLLFYHQNCRWHNAQEFSASFSAKTNHSNRDLDRTTWQLKYALCLLIKIVSPAERKLFSTVSPHCIRCIRLNFYGNKKSPLPSCCMACRLKPDTVGGLTPVFHSTGWVREPSPTSLAGTDTCTSVVECLFTAVSFKINNNCHRTYLL